MRRLTAVLRHRKKKGGSNSLAELTRKTEEKLGLNLGDFASQLTPAQQASLRERKLNFPNLKENGTGLSLCTYFSYCAPSLSTVPIQMLIAAYIFTFYERVGAELPTLAFFQALKGGLEVLSDPAMSYCTDSCRSTHGRRRPFLMWGCIPYAVSLIMLLTPPPWFSGGAASIWFGATYIIFSLCSTATILPYDALAPEVTDHPASRSRLFFTCTVFDGIGSLCACTLPIGINTAITWWRTADFSSCDVPDAATGTISVSSCSGYLSDSLSSRRWTMRGGSAQARHWTRATCESSYVSASDTYMLGGNATSSVAWGDELNGYCVCRDKCEAATYLDNTRGSYFLVGCFFGLWFVSTVTACVCNITERCQASAAGKGVVQLPKPAPLVPSMLKTLRNKPFTMLLPAWICENFATALISALLPYFVSVMVEPEFADPECNGGRSTATLCSSTNVLGAAILAMLVCAVCGAPFWLWLATPGVAGKRNAWLAYSCVSALTNPLFMFVGSGDTYLVICVAGINGLPFGAKFLADAILADVIDYDEFLSGNRAEATYTMFKSFLPKVAAIPASAIPIALLFSQFGYVGPVEGVIQPQTSTNIRWYMRFVLIILPTCLQVLAVIIKLGFPLKTVEQNHLVSAGIGAHMQADKWVEQQRVNFPDWGDVACAPYAMIQKWYDYADCVLNAFKEADTDGDGSLTQAEVQGTMHELGVADSPLAVQHLFDWEADSHGRIGLDEFVHVVGASPILMDLHRRCGAFPPDEASLAKWQHRDEVVCTFWSDPANYLPVELQPQDPVSFVHYNLSKFSTAAGSAGRSDAQDMSSEEDDANRLDNFPSRGVTSRMVQDLDHGSAQKEADALTSRAKLQLGLASAYCLATLLGVILTMRHLFPDSDDKSFVPVLFIVGFGVGLTAVAGSWLRLSAARQIARNPPNAHLAERIDFQRRQQELCIKNVDLSLCSGLIKHPTGVAGTLHRARMARAVAKRWGRPLPFLADMQLSAHAEESADSAPQAAADTVSDDVNQKFRDAFKLYDQDGNGTISKEEFGMAMQSLGMDQSEQDLAEMMALADGDQDGEIDFMEFVEMLTADRTADSTEDPEDTRPAGAALGAVQETEPQP